MPLFILQGGVIQQASWGGKLHVSSLPEIADQMSVNPCSCWITQPTTSTCFDDP